MKSFLKIKLSKIVLSVLFIIIFLPISFFVEFSCNFDGNCGILSKLSVLVFYFPSNIFFGSNNYYDGRFAVEENIFTLINLIISYPILGYLLSCIVVKIFTKKSKLNNELTQ